MLRMVGQGDRRASLFDDIVGLPTSGLLVPLEKLTFYFLGHSQDFCHSMQNPFLIEKDSFINR